MMRLVVTCDACADPDNPLSGCDARDEIPVALGPVPPDSVGFAMLLMSGGWKILTADDVGQVFVCPDCHSDNAHSGGVLHLRLPNPEPTE